MFTFILGSSVLLFIIYYLYGKCNEIYWRKRNVAFYPRSTATGIFWDFLIKDKALFELFHELYKKHRNEPAIGFGAFFLPALYVIDPANVQHVLSSDFNSFSHRGQVINDSDLLANNVLFLNGNRWKLVRQNMTPLFTSAKLKSMYYIIDKSASDFIVYLKSNPELLKGNTFNTLSTFCSAAMGAAVFGVGADSVFDSPFLQMARKVFDPTLIKNLKFTLSNISTTLFKIFNIAFFKEFEPFFIGAIKQVLHERKQENKKKNDFADVCLQIQNSGNMLDRGTGFELKPTDELLAAQGFFFFIAGVEPTASAIFATLVELGKHPEYLERLHNEIDEAFDRHNNEISYDVVNSMQFLDMALSEATRLHPPIGFLTRQCVKDTVLPVGNIKVDKGTKIYTPIYELHHDEKFYPEPDMFKPERFSSENKHNIPDIAYMPFGKGQRICIGMRYANLQTKVGLIHLLRHFTLQMDIGEGGIRYSKQQVQVRLSNVDIKLIPRSPK